MDTRVDQKSYSIHMCNVIIASKNLAGLKIMTLRTSKFNPGITVSSNILIWGHFRGNRM